MSTPPAAPEAAVLTPLDPLTQTFLSQLEATLSGAATLDEVRVWVAERAAALRAPPAATETAPRVTGALFTLLPDDSGCLTHSGSDPGAQPPDTLRSMSASTPSAGTPNRRGSGAWGPFARQKPSRIAHASRGHGSSASLRRSAERMAPLDGASDVASVLHLSFSWSSGRFLAQAARAPVGAGEACSNPLGLARTHSIAGQSLPSLVSCVTPPRGARSGESTQHGSVYGASAEGLLQHGNISLLDQGSEQFAEGMPAFSLDGCLPGQRLVFSRPSSRHTPVWRPLAEVQATLRSVGVPFLEDADSPEVDVISYHTKYGCNDFLYVCLNVMLRYNFSSRFQLNVEKLYRYYSMAATFIRWRNPFHNSSHASDVVLAAHHFLLQPYLAENLSDEEIFAFVFASTVMKLGHVGAENHFLIDVHHPYATAHSYLSPLQSISLSLAFALLDNPEYSFLHTTPLEDPSQTETEDDTPISMYDAPSIWTHEKETSLREFVAQLVAFTDERNHNTLFECLETMRAEGPNYVVHDKHVPTLLCNILHAADFCYLFRCLSTYKIGSACFVVELYRQQSALVHIARHWPPWWRIPPTQRGGEAFMRASLSSPLHGATPVSKIAAIRTLREGRAESAFPLDSGASKPEVDSNANSTRMETRGNEKGNASNGLTPSESPAVTTLGVAEAETFVWPARRYAKEMQLALLEVLFLPYMDAMTPFVPLCWRKDMRSNLEWLRACPADEFEKEVERVMSMTHRHDTALKLCADGFERRVLRCIAEPLYGNAYS